MKRFLWLLALLGALLLSAAPVPADDGFYVVAGRPAVGTRISRLPYTINAPGYYYLGGNLSYTKGHGITVNADNVTIDLMGFTLTGPNMANDYNGIYMSGRKNVEVRNGTLSGWYMGVKEDYSGASRHRMIGIRAVGNRNGINLSGTSHLIKGCTALPGSFGATMGLAILGTGTVSDCITKDFDFGIYISSGTVSGNVVSDCANGIYAQGSTVISHNSVRACPFGINSSGGGSIIGNIVFTGVGQTGILLSTSLDIPNLLDQNLVGPAGTHYGGGSAATVRGVNGG
ncbi:MAG: NosD domain-containing protein [Thermodesulfobacteriota bacterium]